MARNLVLPEEGKYLVTNCMYRSFPSGRGDDPGLVTSKYMATEVFGSTPPRDHAFVPPHPTSHSDTLGPFRPNPITVPIAPPTLNSREVCTSRVAPKAICNIPASPFSLSSVKRRKTLRKLSLNTDCPKESPSTINPPVASTSSLISSTPI